MIEFSARHHVDVQLACYPPYHSKYNPIERVFGVLENYWSGDPLTTIEKALGMAEGMTYKSVHPHVAFVTGDYPKGVKLDKKAMRPYEECLCRLRDLEKWFIKISASTAAACIATMTI